MVDPIMNLRKLFARQMAKDRLKQLAEKHDRLERDWKDFVEKVIWPAFERVEREVFGEKFEPLKERIDPGFKVKDSQNSEFWFWIEIQGLSAVVEARRKFGKSPILSKVLTPLLNSNRNSELDGVTPDDVLGAI